MFSRNYCAKIRFPFCPSAADILEDHSTKHTGDSLSSKTWVFS